MRAEHSIAVASSPQSSNEATHHDTPSTNLTHFSPEAEGSMSKASKGIGKAPLNLAPLTSSIASFAIE
jgi:hypothetical protein